MAHYRFYYIEGEQSIRRGDDMDCGDDEAAKVSAITLLESADVPYDAVEVWASTRLVGRFRRAAAHAA